jgi:hypothetical protein
MIKRNTQWLLAAVAIGLAPAAFAVDKVTKVMKVPEGGSTVIYVIGAGLACFGAMFLRSKLAKPAKSKV